MPNRMCKILRQIAVPNRMRKMLHQIARTNRVPNRMRKMLPQIAMPNLMCYTLRRKTWANARWLGQNIFILNYSSWPKYHE